MTDDELKSISARIRRLQEEISEACDERAAGLAARFADGAKQTHLAKVCGLTQPTVNRAIKAGSGS